MPVALGKQVRRIGRAADAFGPVNSDAGDRSRFRRRSGIA
jgi:hypothetical protein